MKKSTALIPLFEKFIKDCETGKRLKKNGERMKQESIDNFTYTLRNLQSFGEQASFELRICDASKLNTREKKIIGKNFTTSLRNISTKKDCLITMWV